MMRISVTFVMVLAFCFGITAQGNAQKLEDFSGMAGCWEQKNDAKKLLIPVMWMSAAGNSMLGMGRTVKNGKTTGWEYMRIEKREDGIYFVSLG